MQTMDLAVNLGVGPVYRKFTVDYNDVAALGAVTSGTITLFTLPPFSKILGVCVKHSTQFTGATTLTVSLGQSGGYDPATYFTSAANLHGAVADTTLQETRMFKMGQTTALPVIATFTATGANFSALSAGVVDISVCYLDNTTPSESVMVDWAAAATDTTTTSTTTSTTTTT